MPRKSEQKSKEYTIKDVAELAGVSTATVGRVLGGYGSASHEATQAVREAANKLHYIPNGIAQSMKKKTTKSVGLIVANICNPYFSSIARIVESVLVKKGYNIIICNTDEDGDREISYLKMLYEKRIDGLMIASALKESERKDSQFNMTYKESIPTIIIDREISNLKFPTVASDNFRGAYEATSHLIKLGHKRIGIIGSTISTFFRRVEGYRQAMLDHSLPFDTNLVFNKSYKNVKPGDVSEGIYATKNLLKYREYRPTAIFALNNLLTTGVLIAVNDLGLKIPDDVAVIGWDDFDLASLLNPPITVVKQSTYNIATIAISRLLQQIENPNTILNEEKKVILSTELVIRGSCGSNVTY
ncbi:LacI family transcriptional regulator [Pullulanibacillus pueri]|uniref:LacI family transcriptional regulator n=1 Tax=Pullulanibacillus pueri TaxID=1437324 RepID=A0A8J3ENR3_9BACL|nr:LacI family DNA-binding transcriptional regulator [Pullulanibacillus pueri]MBM7683528.1 LacI family transcriptional regulator [Pullulanibacillus pueri]GGH86907.1 LacI family transcriptional regulator [Pullulanibacillus pueri]